ncbi:type II toxin-antitoxin system death-on-curing family toxin [Streptacidiphilus griseoplanus]|uniref:type II toxin-antitoxin system death-on-curing family toxin n=1 Tax=Peterkaempfera griseoplana TaxID=66896 RepID=UPI0006E4416B|nr:type II toxin-antitoxin system death-on-curing family toxin [Peterkaempfera griseoplana]
MTEYLDLSELLIIAARVQGGSEAAVRDYGLIEAALARPQASVFGADAYPTFHEKAAALLHSLARNHALIDGNKRTAWVATRIFHAVNELELRPPDVDSAESLVLAVARGEMDVPAIAKSFALWSTR